MIKVCVSIFLLLLDTWCVYILYSSRRTQLERNIRTLRNNRDCEFLLREM